MYHSFGIVVFLFLHFFENSCGSLKNRSELYHCLPLNGVTVDIVD